MKISFDKFYDIIERSKNPNKYTIILEPKNLLENLSNSKKNQNHYLLTDSDNIFADNKILFVNILKTLLTPGKKKLKQLLDKIKRLHENNYDFIYTESITQELLNEALTYMNKYFKNDNFLIYYDNMLNIDRFSIVLARKIIEEKTKFKIGFIFAYTLPGFKRKSKQEQINSYYFNLYKILELTSMMRMWNKSMFIVNYFFKIKHKINDKKLLGKLFFRIGHVYSKRGHLDKTIKYYQKSKSYLSRTNDRETYVKTLNNLGNMYIDTKRFNKARELFKKALAISEEEQDDYSLSVIYGSLGNVNVKLNKPKRALDNLKKSLLFMARSGFFVGAPIVYCFLGDAHSLLGNNDMAIACFKKAYSFALKSNYKIYQSLSKRKLGNFYYQNNNFDKAKKYYFDAVEINKTFNNQYGLSMLYKDIADLYQSKGKVSEAKKYYRKSLEIYIEYNNSKQIDTINKILKKIENEK